MGKLSVSALRRKICTAELILHVSFTRSTATARQASLDRRMRIDLSFCMIPSDSLAHVRAGDNAIVLDLHDMIIVIMYEHVQCVRACVHTHTHTRTQARAQNTGAGPAADESRRWPSSAMQASGSLGEDGVVIKTCTLSHTVSATWPVRSRTLR